MQEVNKWQALLNWKLLRKYRRVILRNFGIMRFSTAKKTKTNPSSIHGAGTLQLVLFAIAFCTILFWWRYDTSKILPSLTAVLIVACPCSLLLSATFTYGNMLRIFGKNKLYLKNAGVIESLAKINTIVLDKTGTITQNKSSAVIYEGTPLTSKELIAV